MNECPRCQAVNNPGRRFCAECGASLAVACAACAFSNEPSARFCGGCGGPLARPATQLDGARLGSPESYTPKHLAERILTSRAALEGERKQVTVLFADLKGSMELLADRDPEEARRILDPVLGLMMEAVHRYEGTVNQVMGDGIMALFGAPLAHEDHAVRACHAALRMQEVARRHAAEQRRATGIPLAIRVGLNSGEVVPRIGATLGTAYALAGRIDAALTLLERAWEQTTRSMSSSHEFDVGIAVGRTYLRIGRLDEARQLVVRALNQDQRGEEARALWLLAEIRADPACSDDESAERDYVRAMKQGGERGMAPLVAHCHLGLGKLYRRTGKHEQAREHLTTATTMSREMDMRLYAEQAETQMREIEGS